ncbi:unnamed protein product [Spirodela intermedia]|uniref:Uncharacterized protein n=1 Tax=Spirodela intermedia TaxID=51605 RepID=A0A7I8JP29_SPIIN|nr:unnamed protein product [Spirodela intermedia]CAA6671909.1 unnamed protein product [Spirodela intermedia]
MTTHGDETVAPTPFSPPAAAAAPPPSPAAAMASRALPLVEVVKTRSSLPWPRSPGG